MYIILKMVQDNGFFDFYEFDNLEQIRICESYIDTGEYKSEIVPIQLFKKDTEHEEFPFTIIDEDFFEGIKYVSIVGINDDKPVLQYNEETGWFDWIVNIDKIEKEISNIIRPQILK